LENNTMHLPEIGRRAFVLGGASLTASLLAGCATVGSTGGGASVATKPAVPSDVLAMYAATEEEPYFVRRSQIELVAQRYWRQDVADPTGEIPGTVVVDTANRFLYHVQADGRATRYGVGIGRAGFEWSGSAHIAYKREWPVWTPPGDMIGRQPELEQYRHGMAPGPDNPLGPRTLYIHQGNTDTLYRIHGNSDERAIGQAVSSGCVRLLPQDIIHLYGNVSSGSPLLVV
jgi:lipoprotein-anchoring transpeptidase ErfK/SrfK